MGDDHVVYDPTPEWCAAFLVKANRLLGVYHGLLDTPEQRDNAITFNLYMTRLISDEGADEMADGMSDGMTDGVSEKESASHPSHLHGVLYTVSQLRKAISKRVETASALGELEEPYRSELALSYGALDWLNAAAHTTTSDITSALRSPTKLYDLCVYGNTVIRKAVSDASKYYMESNVEQPAIITTLTNRTSLRCTRRLVTRCIVMHTLTTLFDGTRLAAGARLANRAFGDALSPLVDDVRRAELGRSDAYAIMRIYCCLELIVAITMMGAARLSQDISRDEWINTPAGRDILAFRKNVGDTLKAYDDAKRKSAADSQRAYTVQTSGYAAALHEQAALFVAHINEPGRPLYDALVAGFTTKLFCDATSDLVGNSRAISATPPKSFWHAAMSLVRLHEARCTQGNTHRIIPLETAVAVVMATVVFDCARSKDVCTPKRSSEYTETAKTLVWPSESLSIARRQASHGWPNREAFYGRDYADTDRKIAARVMHDGRDPEGREMGESLGFKREWVEYWMRNSESVPLTPLVPLVPSAPTSSFSDEDCVHTTAAVCTLARVETLSVIPTLFTPMHMTPHALPSIANNAIGYTHGIALSCEPGVCTTDNANALYNVGDDRYRRDAIQKSDNILAQKQLFSERMLERTTPLFRAWSGGVLLTECYRPIFAETWKRFNSKIRHADSEWSPKIARWIAHVESGNDRAPPGAKLIHPWRAMRLQQAICRDILEETHGENVAGALSDQRERTGLRLHRALLHRLINVLDYAPWAPHIIRRFCAGDRKGPRKKRASNAPTFRHDKA